MFLRVAQPDQEMGPRLRSLVITTQALRLYMLPIQGMGIRMEM